MEEAELQPGKLYKNTKTGDVYKVTEIAIHSETLELIVSAVIYD